MTERKQLSSILKGSVPNTITFCEVTGTIWDGDRVMIPKWNPVEKKSYLLFGNTRLWVDEFQKAIATTPETIDG